jgi:hypothetical protein
MSVAIKNGFEIRLGLTYDWKAVGDAANGCEQGICDSADYGETFCCVVYCVQNTSIY